MNPNFRFLIEATDNLSPRRIVRSNLTILHEQGVGMVAVIYWKYDLVITASLPCYLKENVDQQRGDGCIPG